MVHRLRRKASRRIRKAPSNVAYTGRIALPSTGNEVRIVKINNSYFYNAVASAGGVLDVALGSGNCTNVADWASLVQTFSEYRVLGMQCVFVPLVYYPTLSSAPIPPLAVVIDHNNANTLGSYAVANSHESCKMHQANKTFSVTAKMNGVEESVFTDINTVFSCFWIKVYGSGYQANFGAYDVQVKFLVELRGRA